MPMVGIHRRKECHMRTRILSSIATATLVLAACGGGGSDGAQGEAADMLIDAAAEEDFDLDEDCVRDLSEKLSDDDAQAIVDAGPDGNAELSPEGEALGTELFSCVDTDAMVDQMVDELVGEVGGDNVDVDCLKDAFRDIDLNAAEDDPAFATAMLECVDLGG
jgi:hypothetical protein